jgi:hypothetical protein
MKVGVSKIDEDDQRVSIMTAFTKKFVNGEVGD